LRVFLVSGVIGVSSPRGCAVSGGPIEAMLLLARRPTIMRLGSYTARCAASGSRNVTWTSKRPPQERRRGRCGKRTRRRRGGSAIDERGSEDYESIAPGAAGDAVEDDDGLQDVTVPLEVLLQALRWRLPCQSAHEHLRQLHVAEPRPVWSRPARSR
jgi:hypothetical protein